MTSKHVAHDMERAEDADHLADLRDEARQLVAESLGSEVQDRLERGNWIQTYNGERFYPQVPFPEDVNPVDIAHALSMLCRFTGHVDVFYSVAEHCVALSNAVAPEFALEALLHDAAEAYVADMSGPIKQNLPAYVAMENRILDTIFERFNVPFSGKLSPEVAEADLRILLTERNKFMKATKYPWAFDGHLEPLPVDVWGWGPKQAEFRYLERLRELLPGVL